MSTNQPLETEHQARFGFTKGRRGPADLSDRIALRFVKTLRFVADRFFAGRYGHRAVVLETVAAVPGMVAGLLQHLKSLRNIGIMGTRVAR